MAIKYNNNTAQNVEYNGVSLDAVVYNNNQVFPDAPLKVTVSYRTSEDDYFKIGSTYYINVTNTRQIATGTILHLVSAVEEGFSPKPHWIKVDGSRVAYDGNGNISLSYDYTLTGPVSINYYNEYGEHGLELTTGV